MNVRKSENGVKRTREHKEFPAGNDSGLSDLDGMERLCCCRKETFCFLSAAGLGEGVRPHLFKRGVEDSTKCPGGYVLAHIHTGYLFGADRRAMIEPEHSGDGRCRT